MDKTFKGLLFFTAAAVLFAISAPVYAQDVVLEDLGIENTGILPSNPFYFFKEWGRNIRKTLSFGDLKKAELQLEILNEQAAEIKKLSDIGSSNFEGFVKAISNYEYNANLLKDRLVVLKNNPNISKLLDSFVDLSLKHQEILNELYDKFKSEEGAENFYSQVTNALDSLAGAVSFVPGNLEDAKKFKERFQLAVLRQKGEFREFLAAEFIDRFEEKVSKNAKSEIIKLKDNLLLKWSGKLQGMRVIELHSTVRSSVVTTDVPTIRSIENIPGGLKSRLNILDEIREKVGDSDVKNQLGIIRQKLLDKAKEENAISKEEAEALIGDVKALIEEINNNLPKDTEAKILVKGFLDRAAFNLESAERFFEEGAYGSAYGQAVSASAAAKSALSKVAVKSGDYLEELKNIKEYYDALWSKASKLELDKGNNPELFAAFADAENQIAKISDLINKGSESLKISSAIRELKLLLSSIEQIIEEANRPSASFGSTGALASISNTGKITRSTSVSEVISENFINISDNQFIPAVLKIKKGSRVTWINKDASSHWMVFSGIRDLDSGEIAPTDSFSFVFNSSGFFKYKDKLNPSMIGIIDVE